MAKYHRNDKRNMDPHHLYEIIDIEEDEVFKYGISLLVDILKNIAFDLISFSGKSGKKALKILHCLS